jgi:hypothetical protein
MFYCLKTCNERGNVFDLAMPLCDHRRCLRGTRSQQRCLILHISGTPESLNGTHDAQCASTSKQVTVRLTLRPLKQQCTNQTANALNLKFQNGTLLLDQWLSAHQHRPPSARPKRTVKIGETPANLSKPAILASLSVRHSAIQHHCW